MNKIPYKLGYVFKTSICGRMADVVCVRYHGAGTADVKVVGSSVMVRVSGLPLVQQ